MTDPYCGNCHNKVDPRDALIVEFKDDGRIIDDYVLCPSCKTEVTDDWMTP